MALRPTILVVDDDSTFLKTAELAFRTHGEVLTASSPERAVEILESRQVNVIITDFMMAGGTGHDVARACNCLVPRPPVILITAFADKELAIKSIELQIFSLLEKPVDIEKLTETLDRALAEFEFRCQETGLKGHSSEEIGGHRLILEPVTREASHGENRVTLTVTEYKLLSLLLQNRGRRVRREEMIRAIWGDLHVSSNVFDTHFSNLKRKLPSLRENLIVVRGKGYVLKG